MTGGGVAAPASAARWGTRLLASSGVGIYSAGANRRRASARWLAPRWVLAMKTIGVRAGVGIAAQLFGQREAVAVAQPGVEDHRVGLPHGDAALGPGGLGLGGQLVAGGLQGGADRALQLGVLLDDEHVAGHRAAVSLSAYFGREGPWTIAGPARD